jgi:uncharacterized protein
MKKKDPKNSRRDFLKAVGAIGAGSVLSPLTPFAGASDKKGSTDTGLTTVPTRPFGKTGICVSTLSLGGVLGESDQLVFRQAFKMGVTYWDTADSYGWGGNEKAIGKYLTRFPEDRGNIFLVTKAATSDPKELTEKLDRSLQRMNTSYVDLYFIHYVKDVKEELTKEVKTWAEKAKASGKIRLFGFSAHKNMENSLLAASKLGWIDGIMMSYNYRLMVQDEMKKAVDACAKAGIGLTAMKTQASFSANFYASIGSETDSALEITESFLKKGYTKEQAKLKVVWENANIASICSAMPNMTILQANIAAATNKTSLSSRDKKLLNLYARQTSSGYCAGCADICESAVNGNVPISDLMRYSMYHDSYNDKDTAKALFSRLPEKTKANILTTDYKEAEKRCPQKMKIGAILADTYNTLA